MTARSASMRKVRFTKPGPAAAALSTSVPPVRPAAIASARTLGDCRAALAMTMAALVAMSPWPGSLAGLTSTRASASTGTSGATARTTSITAARTRA